MRRAFANFGFGLRTLQQKAAALSNSAGLKQLNALADLNPERVRAAQRAALTPIIPTIRQMLLHNMHTAGIQNRTGTLEKAVAGAIVEVTTRNIFVKLPSGMRYKEGGNLYAAAGVFRYGGLRGKRGDRVKRHIKRSLERAGKTKSSDGNFTRIPAKPPFFQLTEAQRDFLQRTYASNVAAELRALGIPASATA